MGWTECSIGHGVIKATHGLLIVMRGVKNTVHSCTRQEAEGAAVAVRHCLSQFCRKLWILCTAKNW